jgi:thiol-disulfide isomerase/thioredoxin
MIFTGCSDRSADQKSQNKQTAAPQNTPAVKNRFTLSDGNRSIILTPQSKGFSIDGLEAPVVMLDFFATWCPPCRAEIPHLVNLQKHFKGKLAIVGVLVENKHPAELERFIHGFHINYFVSNAPDNLLLASRTAEMLGMPQNFSIPMMVLLVNGRYFRHYVGMAPEEMLQSDIEEALKEAK